MKRLLSGSMMAFVTISVVMPFGANAADRNMACVKGEEARFIQIVSPGEVGRICDVRYTRDRGRNVSIPYHADNSDGFCEQKAADLIATLQQAGYRCASTTPDIIAQAKTVENVDLVTAGISVPTPTRARNAQQTSTGPVSTEQPSAILPSVIISAPVDAELPKEVGTTEQTIIESPTTELQQENIADASQTVVASVGETQPTDIPAIELTQEPEAAIDPETGEGLQQNADLQDKMNQILAEAPAEVPAQAATQTPSLVEQVPLETPMGREPAEITETVKLAVRGPAQLTNAQTSTAVSAHSSSVVGRIVGAAPELEPVTGVTQASLEAAPTPSRRPQSNRYKYSKRSPQDIVLATLNAQVAAWNEGNLQAFMDMYWKSEDLKYVSGSTVTMGWTATLKQYRERFGSSGRLGQLAIDKTDVQMVSEDVAIATGRYHHTDQAVSANGDFSLVMKRMDGAWRIVHDHSVDDPTQDQ